jgi:hypothetical protein
MNKEKQLTINLLTEKLQRLTGRKVSLKEGTWAIPENKEQAQVAIDAIKTIDRLVADLYNVVGDDSLYDSLGNAKARIQQLIPEEFK